MADALKVAQLVLVQPSDTAVLLFRAACVLAGTAAPAWLAFKAAKPEAGVKAKDAALRLAVAAAAVQLGEQLLAGPAGVARWRLWPSAKLGVLLWLLLDGGKGAGVVHGWVEARLSPIEPEVDALVVAASPLLAHAASSYVSPLKAAASSCVAVAAASVRLWRARRARRLERERRAQQAAWAEQLCERGGRAPPPAVVEQRALRPAPRGGETGWD
ncbi:MAG: hypothetical protein J3K34DRAFT_436933 [Monoraphidium minutum]|nr:MAG: hypothetical protein J3K34DRAFT_436933 [Monoraphidium minutum]